MIIFVAAVVIRRVCLSGIQGARHSWPRERKVERGRPISKNLRSSDRPTAEGRSLVAAAGVTSNGRTDGKARNVGNEMVIAAALLSRRNIRFVAGRGITQPNTRFLGNSCSSSGPPPSHPSVHSFARMPCLVFLSFRLNVNISQRYLPRFDSAERATTEGFMCQRHFHRKDRGNIPWRAGDPAPRREDVDTCACAFLASWRPMQVGKIRAFPP